MNSTVGAWIAWAPAVTTNNGLLGELADVHASA